MRSGGFNRDTSNSPRVLTTCVMNRCWISAAFLSTQRLTASRFARRKNVSVRMTPSATVDVLSKAPLMTLVNMTSKSLTAPLKSW